MCVCVCVVVVQKSLQAMAAWLAPVEVLAFASAEEYDRACVAEPSLRAHLLMHCDAAEGADSDSESDSEEGSEGEGSDEGGKSGRAKRGCGYGAKDAARACAGSKRSVARLPAAAATSITPDKLQKLHEAMGMVPAVPAGLKPWRVLRLGGLLCQVCLCHLGALRVALLRAARTREPASKTDVRTLAWPHRLQLLGLPPSLHRCVCLPMSCSLYQRK